MTTVNKMPTQATADPATLAALKRFKDANGRRWRSVLRQAWETGIYLGTSDTDTQLLQAYRNSQNGGPRGLARIRFARTLRRLP